MNKPLPWWRLLCVLVLWSVANEVCAQTLPNAPIQFNALSSEQQSALQQFSKEWSSLDQQTRNRLLKGAERWQKMTPEQRKLAAERASRFAAMSEERRAELRERMRMLEQLSPQEKRQLRQAMLLFRQLPPQERQRLKQLYSQMNPEQRKAFLLGLKARIGTRTNAASRTERQRMWEQIPPADRRATMAMLRSFSRLERRQLGKHLQSLPEPARVDLLSRLRAMSEIQRAEFVRGLR